MVLNEAERFFRWREYGLKKQAAGIMPCMHVAVATNNGSSASGGGSSGTAHFEHHAIWDTRREVYIHVSTIGSPDGEYRVIRTGRREFRAAHPAEPRVVGMPETQQEGDDILARAHGFIDGENAAGENAAGRWQFNVVTNNCEHFVTQCWRPETGPRSSQVQVAATVGGTGLLGGVGGGLAGGFGAAAYTVSTTTVTMSVSPYYLLGFIPWGTTTTATTTTSVVAGWSPAAVAGIAAGAAVGGILLVGGAGYGIHQWVAYDREWTSAMLGITVYNTSEYPCRARIGICDGYFPGFWDWQCWWRAMLSIGTTSCDVKPSRHEGLNPSIGDDDWDRTYELTLESEQMSPSITVQRGDVIVFDGTTVRKADENEERDDTCCICWVARSNTLLEPCKHFQFCDGCIAQLLERNARRICPMCNQNYDDFYVDHTRDI